MAKLNKQFRRMQKLAGILNENEEIDNFIDVLTDMAIKANIIKDKDINKDEVIDALYDTWEDMGFDDYEETGQGISTSDYNRSLEIFTNYIKDK